MVKFCPDKLFSRCMEHTVHLGAGHFIRVVFPTSAHTLIKKICNTFHDAQLDDVNINFNLWKLSLEATTMTMTP